MPYIPSSHRGRLIAVEILVELIGTPTPTTAGGNQERKLRAAGRTGVSRTFPAHHHPVTLYTGVLPAKAGRDQCRRRHDG